MKPDSQRQNELRGEVYSCHVSPLPIDMRAHQLRNLFKDYNDVCGAYVFPHNVKENVQYTYGFIRFKSKKSADHAVQYFTSKVKRWPLAVRHSNGALKQRATKTNKSDSEPSSLVLDEDYVQVFKQFSDTDSTKENFDSTLKNINKKRGGSFQHQPPTSALSVDLTETTTENTDYKLWYTFFRAQKDISKCLMQILQNQESLDISNSGKCDPRQSKSKSIIKEKDPEKDVCDSIEEICLSANKAHFEDQKGIGRGNLCILNDLQSSRQSSSSKEFIHSESEEDKPYYISEDTISEYSSDDDEDNSYHVSEDLCPKRNSFSPRDYPIGRGMGLAYACHDDYSTGFSNSNTHPAKENIDESLGSLDIFLDP